MRYRYLRFEIHDAAAIRSRVQNSEANFWQRRRRGSETNLEEEKKTHGQKVDLIAKDLNMKNAPPKESSW